MADTGNSANTSGNTTSYWPGGSSGAEPQQRPQRPPSYNRAPSGGGSRQSFGGGQNGNRSAGGGYDMPFQRECMLFIGNVPPTATELEVHGEFKKRWGNLIGLRIHPSKNPEYKTSYGFIHFKTEQERNDAYEDAKRKNVYLHNNKIYVAPAFNNRDRPGWNDGRSHGPRRPRDSGGHFNPNVDHSRPIDRKPHGFNHGPTAPGLTSGLAFPADSTTPHEFPTMGHYQFATKASSPKPGHGYGAGNGVGQPNSPGNYPAATSPLLNAAPYVGNAFLAQNYAPYVAYSEQPPAGYPQFPTYPMQPSYFYYHLHPSQLQQLAAAQPAMVNQAPMLALPGSVAPHLSGADGSTQFAMQQAATFNTD